MMGMGGGGYPGSSQLVLMHILLGDIAYNL